MLALNVLLLLFAQEPAAVPDAGAIREAEKLIKDIFKEEYAKKAPADRNALAKKFLEQSAAAKDDLPSRYVLLREAASLAAQGGDLATVLKAVEDLGRAFRVDVAELRSDALSTASKNARTPDDFAQLSSAYLTLASDALLSDDFTAADKATLAAIAQARKCQSIPLANRATAKSKEISDLKARFEKVRKSKQTLIAEPNDPSANQEVGVYECFTKNNWSVGLPLLAKAADAVLKEAAARDVAEPAGAVDQAAAGDAWWDLAEKQTGPGRDIVRARARGWYEKAVAKLTGLSLTKIEKRLLELRMEFLNRGVWMDVSDPKLYGKSGTEITLVSGQKTRLAKPPAGEFDGFSVRVKVPAGQTSARVSAEYEIDMYSFFVYQDTREVTNSRLEATTWRGFQRTPCPPKEQYLLTVLLVDREYVGYLDGREYFRNSTTRDHLTPFEFWVSGGTATVSFDQVRLRKRQ